MLTTIIEQFLRNISASTLTEAFLITLVGSFTLLLFLKSTNRLRGLTNYAPTLLTSIGILGTFTGIITGLLDFNTNDIDGSIGPLLDGLKTAFITSLAGMLLSIVYKSVVLSGLLTRRPASDQAPETVDIKDLYNIMHRQADGIDQLKMSISENDDSSLIGQFKLLRSDLSDHQKVTSNLLTEMNSTVSDLLVGSTKNSDNFKEFEQQLWNKLQDFADMLSKSATEQVIEALKLVIQDFNNNLQEQFGDNFKLLNNSVLELVAWQENYKIQLGEMTMNYANGVKAITQTEQAVASISHEAQNIPEIMSNLKTVMEVNQHQISELDRHLDAFKGIRDKAVEAVPEIRGQIDQAIAGAKEANDKLAEGILESVSKVKNVITDGANNYRDCVDQTRASLTESAQATANSSEQIKQQFSDALHDINKNMRNLIQELQEGGKNLNESYKSASTQLISETEDASKVFIKGIESMRLALSSTITEQANEHREQADRIFAGLDKSIESALIGTGESVQKQVEMIDQTMGEEVQKVMQSMGDALSSISRQFTNDYSTLVDRMSDIVRQQA